MWKAIGFGGIGAVVGYLFGAGLGIVLVSTLSSNRHDKSVEVATTALLVTGPLGLLLGLLVGAVVGYTRR